jgi:two-component sensor histidine kinase
MLPVSLTVSPMRNRNGEIVGASKIARDISAARESERRIRLLMREVNHRVKNQFAVILSMIRETVKRAEDARDFEVQMRERIMALSRSHDLLVSSEWAGASLFELVSEHLEPFGHVEQISLSGPLVTLQPNAVQYLGMAFHELGTNSAKYGALSGTVGRILVSWTINQGLDGERELSIIWEETSVPGGDRSTDSRRGFGAVVLQRVTPQALQGSATLERAPGHVKWTLVAPLNAMLERGDRPD